MFHACCPPARLKSCLGTPGTASQGALPVSGGVRPCPVPALQHHGQGRRLLLSRLPSSPLPAAAWPLTQLPACTEASRLLCPPSPARSLPLASSALLLEQAPSPSSRSPALRERCLCAPDCSCKLPQAMGCEPACGVPSSAFILPSPLLCSQPAQLPV